MWQFKAMRASSQYEISIDPTRLDIPLIHDFLTTTYWARGIPRAIVEKSIQNSLCFGAYHDHRQVGLARVITDRATFAYIADVFVLPGHRGRGVAKMIIRAILEHPDLQVIRRFLLATQDAHGLYRQVGFQPLEHPEHFMTIGKPDVYLSQGAAASRKPAA
jgi:GNAT superfamily N-acetyltransferase